VPLPRTGVRDATLPPVPNDDTRPLVGDELVPGATVAMNRVAVLEYSAEAIWPWLAQLGKGRAGWYMPRRLERFLVPVPKWRGAREILPEFQQLEVGERVPDYGRDEWFEVASIEPPKHLVYRSLRGWPGEGAWPAPGERITPKTMVLSWAIVIEELGPEQTKIHLRLRARKGQSVKASRAFTLVGDQFDRATVLLMFAGLRERLAESRGQHPENS